MIERLETILKRYEEVSNELVKPEVMNDYNMVKKLSKEQRDLEEIVNKYNEYKKVLKNIDEAKELIHDSELASVAELELAENQEAKTNIEEELKVLLIPKDENDDKNIIMEIRGAAGGDEANIFAGDLFRMYSHYAEKNGWKIEITNEVPGTSGGYSQVECMKMDHIVFNVYQ